MKTEYKSIHDSVLHVAWVVHVYKKYEDPFDLIKAFFSTTDWAGALVKKNALVSIFYRFHKDAHINHQGVDYYFIKDNLPEVLRQWHMARQFNKAVAGYIYKLGIDLVHGHNPHQLLANWDLKKRISSMPFIIQDHSGRMNSRFKFLLKFFLKDVNALLFSSPGMELLFTNADIIRPDQCYFIMESSSSFEMKSRVQSREITGLNKHLVFLWVANLIERKDPLTALYALNDLIAIEVDFHFYMIFMTDELRPEIENYLDRNPLLKERTHLLGSFQRKELENYYNSSDYLISPSFREGSGYSVIEAISCGVIPILSDIPSFRSLTNNGQIGQLFEAGSPEDLFEKLVIELNLDLPTRRSETIDYFKKEFSFERLAEKQIETYLKVIGQSLI